MTSQRQKVASPEIRRMLRQRLGPRYHIPGRETRQETKVAALSDDTGVQR